MASLSFPSPIGALTLFEEDGHIVVLEFGRAPESGAPSHILTTARAQLDDYFDGKRHTFDVPLAPPGTRRQQDIWQAMTEIPYGQVETYGALATRIDSAARAVGSACAANPLPIFIPCHRVLPAAGGLGAYSFADGEHTKRQLLTLEGYSGNFGTGLEPDEQIAMPF